MKLLLDTHAFLWFVGNDPRLSEKARLAIESSDHQKWVSVASCWEIAVKCGLGKLKLADAVDVFVPREIATNRFSVLPIELRHVTFVADMANHHRDPFDRLLIAQASIESFEIVGCDTAFDAYGISRLW